MKDKIYRVPIKRFRDADAVPKRGKEIIYKTRLGKTVKTKVIKINRSEVLLKEVGEKNK